MSRAPFATWDPVSASPVPWTTPTRRVVHHKTQTAGGTTAALYPGGGKNAPHFTVDENGVRQHFDTTTGGSRALVNLAGGVETNSFGAIQIEVVGYSGVTMPGATAGHLVELLHWIEQTHGVPWVWPNGRPDPARPTPDGPVDPGNHDRSTAGWAQVGHFGHSNVPENLHWDPAYTDLEWFVLNQAMAPQATAVVLAAPPPAPAYQEHINVNERSHFVTMKLGPDGKGWALTTDALTSPVFIAKEQGHYTAIGAGDVYSADDVLDFRAFMQDGKVEIVVESGRPGADVGFEVLEFVPS